MCYSALACSFRDMTGRQCGSVSLLCALAVNERLDTIEPPICHWGKCVCVHVLFTKFCLPTCDIQEGSYACGVPSLSWSYLVLTHLWFWSGQLYCSGYSTDQCINMENLISSTPSGMSSSMSFHDLLFCVCHMLVGLFSQFCLLPSLP